MSAPDDTLRAEEVDTAEAAPTVALVLVSHSADVARGTRDMAAQMAPRVHIEAVGGRGDGGLGTDFDRVTAAVADALAVADGVVALADLGSAVLVVESVLDVLDEADRVRAHLVNAPFVRGAVAASVAADGGADTAEVVAAARRAASSFEDPAPPAEGARGTAPTAPLGRTVRLRNSLGLHARPAAVLARLAAGFDAEVTVAGVDASSVLELMGLGATGGQTLEVTASGPQAAAALDAVAREIEGGFGEA